MLMQARKCFGNCLPVRMYQWKGFSTSHQWNYAYLK
jgi:hypothetical protein